LCLGGQSILFILRPSKETYAKLRRALNVEGIRLFRDQKDGIRSVKVVSPVGYRQKHYVKTAANPTCKIRRTSGRFIVLHRSLAMRRRRFQDIDNLRNRGILLDFRWKMRILSWSRVVVVFVLVQSISQGKRRSGIDAQNMWAR
jgi:hypothetical protein